MKSESIIDIALSNIQQPTLEEILHDCCEVFKQPVALVKSKSRNREYVTVRRIYSYVALQLTNATLQKTAESIGLLNHTTILAHLKQTRSLLHSKDIYFLRDWNVYVTTSKIWNKYT